MKYVYPAIFTKEEGQFSVEFPDVPECITCGDSLEEAIYMAEDALALVLFTYEKNGSAIPEATEIGWLNPGDNEFASYIACDTLEYHKRNSKKSVKKTLSIPEWLNEEAIARNVNFSQILQEALKAHLGIHL